MNNANCMKTVIGGLFLLLVLSACSSGSKQKTAATASPQAANAPAAAVSNMNSFFGLHIDTSLQHARDAEIAGNLGQAPELLEHAKISLMQAREAQRGGNAPGLNEGIAFLRKALSPSLWLTQASTQASPSSAQGVDPRCIDELERQCGEVQPGGGRIQKCFDDKVNNFSPMCQEKLKEGKAGIAAAILENRQQKELAGTSREESGLREATNFVREARKNLSQAAGVKYVEIEPQPTRTVSSER